MDNEVRALRLENGIPAKEMVSVVRALYPKFDKTLLSKCEHGDLYGVDLRQDALAAIKQHISGDGLSEAKNGRKADKRRKPGRYVRLSQNDYTALQQAIRADGYSTMQSWLEEMIKKYLDGRGKTEVET